MLVTNEDERRIHINEPTLKSGPGASGAFGALDASKSDASVTSLRALLIVNPKSRTGAEAALDDGIQQLNEAGWQVERLESQSAQESRRAVLERKEQLDLVIVGGGDGTISSMALTLYECQLPFAVLPLGTANDLARSLCVADGLPAAFEAIATNRRARIALGEVNGHFFFNVANIGLGVKVTEALTPEVKKHWGVLSYFKAFLDALTRTNQFRVKLKVNGHSHKCRSIQLAVGNGRYYGGGNIVDEKATIDDGDLWLYSLRPLKLWEILLLAPVLRSGKHDGDARSYNTQGTEIDVATKPSHMAVHADGERVTETPARFRIRPGALEVIVGENFTENNQL